MDGPTTSPCMADDGAVDAALFEGHVDAIEAGRIYGWALDPADPAQPLRVTILHGEDALGTVVADRFREDLRNYGDGSGRHAFVFTLPKALWDADPAGFHVVHAGSSVPLVRPEGELRKLPPAGAGPGLDGGPDWLAPVSARIAHLETALVSTARAAALTQINLRELGRPEGRDDGRDDRLSTIEQSQMRIDQALRIQSAALSELRAAVDRLRGGGRLHLALTLALLPAVAALATLVLRPELLS